MRLDRTFVPPVSALWEERFHTRFGGGASSSVAITPITEPSLALPVILIVPFWIREMVPPGRYCTVPPLFLASHRFTRANPLCQFLRRISGVRPQSISVPSGFKGQRATVPPGTSTVPL